MERARQFEVHLTDRQRQVWRLVAKGHTNGEIAEKLGITLDGAKWHVGELLTKLGAATREDLVEAWESQRGLFGRAGQSLRGMFAISWAKAALAAGVVAGSAGIAGVLYASGRAGPEAVEQAPLPGVSLPPQPQEATLQAPDAYAFARYFAAQRMAEHLSEFVASPSTTIGDLRLTAAQWLNRNGSFEVAETNYRWDAPAFATNGAWAFSWVGLGFGEVDGPMGGVGDLRIDVIVTDEASPAVAAWRAHAVVGDRPMKFGSSAGFGTAWEATSDTFHAGWLNGEEGTGLVAMFRMEDSLCHIFSTAEGWGGGSCGPSRRPGDHGIVARQGGAVGTFAGTAGAVAVVYTSDDIVVVRVVDSARAETGPFPTAEMPRELTPAGRIAVFNAPPFDDSYDIVGYAVDGSEVARVNSLEPPYPPGLP